MTNLEAKEVIASIRKMLSNELRKIQKDHSSDLIEVTEYLAKLIANVHKDYMGVMTVTTSNVSGLLDSIKQLQDHYVNLDDRLSKIEQRLDQLETYSGISQTRQ